jgi:hypothetical protein
MVMPRSHSSAMSRGLLDGSNMYRRLKICLADGIAKKVRVGRALRD